MTQEQLVAANEISRKLDAAKSILNAWEKAELTSQFKLQINKGNQSVGYSNEYFRLSDDAFMCARSVMISQLTKEIKELETSFAAI